MVRPRWQKKINNTENKFWDSWNKIIAFAITFNISWLIFDLSYIPLRHIWKSREIYPFNSNSIKIPFKFLPDITSFYDKTKGIEEDYQSKKYINHYI